MKKNLLMAITAVMVMSSCSKNEMVDTTVSANTPIGFSSYMGTTTKGVSLDPASFLEFEVSAYHTTEAITATGAKTEYINADKVTKNGNTWASTDTHYWPTTGNLSFYAYAPLTYVTYVKATGATMPGITYTSPVAVAEQKDVVVAKAEDKKSATDGSAPVAMTFGHALTKVNFSATGAEAGFTYNVTSLKVANVKNVGTYTFLTNPAWETTEDAAVEYGYFTGKKDVLTTGTKLQDNDDASLMLIPQNASAITVTVAYTVSKDGVEISNTPAAVTTLAGTWEIGKNIRYNLTLPVNGKKITFTASVENWADETPGTVK